VHGTTAVGAEIAHTFSSNENTVTIGSQHELGPLTTVKARFNNFGIASVIKAICNNEERKEITARRHKILTWKTLSNKER
jgi:hypothetical protein